MAGVIVPVAKTVYLCREVIGHGAQTDLFRLFTTLTAPSLPYEEYRFCAFAQLAGGLGDMAVHFELRRAADGQLVRATVPRVLRFPDRTRVVQVATAFEGIRFDAPGIYLAELYCDNVWVADNSFEVRQGTP